MVESEWLDALPPAHPEAHQSRQDLQRLNSFMGHTKLMPRLLSALTVDDPPQCVVDLGAGDGRFSQTLAHALARRWPGVKLVLVDAQARPEPATRAQIEAAGWRMEPIQADVLHWLEQAEPQPRELHVCNLFLHHFSAPALARIFDAAAKRASFFAALEPRRFAFGLACSRMVRFLGCNRVTRHDAPASVRAGFARQELSALWPSDGPWQLSEGPAGFFSHFFAAGRVQPP